MKLWKIRGDGPTIPAGALEPATTADLLAVVRRGVESGTIKGEVRGWCVGHKAPMATPDTCLSARWFRLMQSGKPSITEPKPCDVEQRLVIPVSDGGSET